MQAGALARHYSFALVIVLSRLMHGLEAQCPGLPSKDDV